MTPRPSIGRIVHYQLHERDISHWPGESGDLVPAIVVREVSEQVADLTLFMQGGGTSFVAEANMGKDPGTWCWPVHVGGSEAAPAAA